MPDVYAPELPGRIHRQVQIRQVEGGCAFGHHVVRELEHDAQPLQQLVGGVHGSRGIAAAGDERRAAVERDRLQQVAAFGIQHREVDGAPIGEPPHRGVLIGASDQNQRGAVALRASGQLRVRDDRQPSAGQPFHVRLQLAGHEAVELVRIRARDHRPARGAVLEQSVSHDA